MKWRDIAYYEWKTSCGVKCRPRSSFHVPRYFIWLCWATLTLNMLSESELRVSGLSIACYSLRAKWNCVLLFSSGIRKKRSGLPVPVLEFLLLASKSFLPSQIPTCELELGNEVVRVPQFLINSLIHKQSTIRNEYSFFPAHYFPRLFAVFFSSLHNSH